MIINSVLTKGYYDDRSEKERCEILKKIWESDRYGVILSDKCITPFDRSTSLLNRDLRKWLEWVNLNICLPIACDTEKTTGVKLRIATGMLNRINSLSDIDRIVIHRNLIENVYTEKQLIIFDSLPF